MKLVFSIFAFVFLKISRAAQTRPVKFAELAATVEGLQKPQFYLPGDGAEDFVGIWPKILPANKREKRRQSNNLAADLGADRPRFENRNSGS